MYGNLLKKSVLKNEAHLSAPFWTMAHGAGPVGTTTERKGNPADGDGRMILRSTTVGEGNSTQ